MAFARLLLDERVEPDFATTLLRVGLPAVRVPAATAPTQPRTLHATGAPEHRPRATRRPPLPLATSLLLAAIGAFAGVTLGTFVVRSVAVHDARPPVIHQR